MRPTLAKAIALGGALSVAAGVALAGSGAWTQAKSRLAQRLIDAAWQEGRTAARAGPAAAPRRPWAWADTEPVARLRFERQRRSYVVLAGDSGAVLAFGPGHHPASAPPGGQGNAVISGHRDTHFGVLRELAVGDPISVERRDGHRVDYRVAATAVVDGRDPGPVAPTPDDRLTLVTCWPFDALRPGGPLRYVVVAERTE